MGLRSNLCLANSKFPPFLFCCPLSAVLKSRKVKEDRHSALGRENMQLEPLMDFAFCLL